MRTLGLSRERQQKTSLGVFALGSLVWQGMNTVLILFMMAFLVVLATKNPPELVQLEQGRSIVVEPIDSGERTPAVIQSFVRDTMMILLSASGRFPTVAGEDPVTDPGVEIPVEGGIRKISTAARLAAFGLSSDFRTDFLKELAQHQPDGIFEGRAQSVLVIKDLSVPAPIAGEENKWKIVMIADIQEISTQHPEGLITPFNKEIFVQSVLPAVAHEYSTDWEQQIAQIRGAGLEIYAIRNYIPEDFLN